MIFYNQIITKIFDSFEFSDPIKEEKLDQFESDNDGNITDNLTVNYDFSVENEIFKSRKEKVKIITQVTTENDQNILDSNQKCYEVKIEDELQPLELVTIFKFRAISRKFLFILNFF